MYCILWFLFQRFVSLGETKRGKVTSSLWGIMLECLKQEGAVMGLSEDCNKNQFWKAILKSLVLGEKVMNATLFIYSLTHERIPSKLFLSTIRKARRNSFNINFSWKRSSFLISSRKRWSSSDYQETNGTVKKRKIPQVCEGTLF